MNIAKDKARLAIFTRKLELIGFKDIKLTAEDFDPVMVKQSGPVPEVLHARRLTSRYGSKCNGLLVALQATAADGQRLKVQHAIPAFAVYDVPLEDLLREFWLYIVKALDTKAEETATLRAIDILR